jgi:hypothetical protein
MRGNNSILAEFYGKEVVPSASWSATNATLCLGCIDESAYTGDFHTFKPAEPKANASLSCALQMNVEQIYWFPKPGVEGTYLVKNGFQACVDPGVGYLVLSEEVRAAFEKATERDLKEELDDRTILKGEPGSNNGLLNFRLEGGLVVNVTIPGAGESGNEDGEWEVPIGQGGLGAYGANAPVLGKPFTDQVVLKWDSDAQEYGIANINEEPDTKENLKPLGCDKFPEKKAKTLAPATATILGVAVGCFVGGAVFALALVWFFRRGKKSVKSKYEPMRSEETLPLGSMAGDRRTMDSMMSGASSIHSASFSQRPVSITTEPQLVEDNAVFEAPEGGTAYPTKRSRNELNIPTVHHR